MPEAIPGPDAIQCSFCNQPTHPMGIFRGVHPSMENQMLCFACIYIACLNGSTCGMCGATDCAGFVTTAANGRLTPVPVCHRCIPTLQPHEATETMCENRNVLPEGEKVN